MKRLASWFMECLAAPLLWVLLVLLVLAGFAPPAHAQATPSVTFGVSGKSSDGKTVVPTLTWSTTPAATSCTGSGDAAWAGAKAASGTQVLPATSTSKTYALVCSWPGVTLATLTWTKPTLNNDGTPYTNPGGYRIQYGNKSAAEVDLDQSVYTEDPVGNSWTSPNLAPGTWYFGVKAYNNMGLESALSNVVNKVLVAAATRNAGVDLVLKAPMAPSGLTVQ